MKIREIERLRALAILMVFVQHAWMAHPLLSSLLVGAWSGVDLFFVISGYVVTRSLLELLPPTETKGSFADAFATGRRALRVFYTRRFFRIVPAALAVVLFHGAVILVAPGDYFGYPQQWLTETIAIFGGIYNYVVPALNHKLFGIYWSLSVEEHFYLVIPLLFLALRTTGRRLFGAVVVIALVALVVRPFAHPSGQVDLESYERFSSHVRFDSLMAGSALSLLSTNAPSAPILPKRLVSFVLVPVAIALVWTLPAAVPKYVMQREGFVALWMLSGVLVAYAGLDRGYVLEVPVVSRVLEYVGSRSYAIYLVHSDVLRALAKARVDWPAYGAWVPDGREAALRHTAIAILATLAAAEMLHRGIEQPLMRFGRRLAAPHVPAREG